MFLSVKDKLNIKLFFFRKKLYEAITGYAHRYPYRIRAFLIITSIAMLTLTAQILLTERITNKLFMVSAKTETESELSQLVRFEEELSSGDSSHVKGAFIRSRPEGVGSSYLVEDIRILILQDFFHKYKSPLEIYAAEFIRVADQYNVESWQLIPAISINETNGCQTGISDHQHNCWGWGGGPKNRVVFDSYEKAIDVITSQMQKTYGNERMNPKDIQNTYCGLNCFESRGWEWAIGVNSYIKEINTIGLSYGLERSNEVENFD